MTTPKDFQLAAVEFVCGFPESPIFRESTAAVANSKIAKFDRWIWLSNTLFLAIEKPPTLNLRLSERQIRADIQPAPSEGVPERLAIVHEMALATLESYGYESVTSAHLKLRYMAPSPDAVSRLARLQDPSTFLPDWAAPNVKDIGIDVAFSYKDFWWYTHIFSAFKNELVGLVDIPNVTLPEIAIVITCSLENPRTQTVVPVALVEQLLATPLADFSHLLDPVTERIAAP